MLISGCAKNKESLLQKKPLEAYLSSNINGGILTYIGNSFEYYKSNMFSPSKFILTEVNSWEIDNLVSSSLHKKMKKLGFDSIKVIHPNKNLILERNIAFNLDRHGIVSPSAYKIMLENNLNLLIYVESFPFERHVSKRRIESDLGKINIFTSNLSIIDSPSSKTLRINLVYYIVYDKDLEDGNIDTIWSFYSIKNQKVENIKFIKNQKVYSKDNLALVKGDFFKLINSSIDDFFMRSEIKQRILNNL